MAASNIFREYLIKLGFGVDQAKLRAFEKTITNVDESVAKLGKGLLAVGVAAQAAVTVFSFQMEKLYYKSRLAASSAKELTGLAFAGKQIGLGADALQDAVTGLAMQMRMNPGVAALIEQLGIPVQGRTVAAIAMDLFEAMKGMDFPVAAKYGSEIFGLGSPEQIFQILDNLDALKKAKQEQEELDKKANIDRDEAARVGKEYAQTIHQLVAAFDRLYSKGMKFILPYFQSLTSEFGKLLDEINQLLDSVNGLADLDTKLSDLLGKKFRKMLGLGENKGDEGWDTRFLDWLGLNGKSAMRPNVPPEERRRSGVVGPAPGSGGIEAYFRGLERKYGLPEGLLYRMEGQESTHGKNMLSPKGAKGWFGFKDATAKEYGVEPMNRESSALGASRYMHDLLAKYNGDIGMALAAYNWGPGNLDKYGLGKAPAETRDYMKLGEGLSVQQGNTNITISGVSDPAEAARRAANEQRSVNSDFARNLSTVIE